MAASQRVSDRAAQVGRLYILLLIACDLVALAGAGSYGMVLFVLPSLVAMIVIWGAVETMGHSRLVGVVILTLFFAIFSGVFVYADIRYSMTHSLEAGWGATLGSAVDHNTFPHLALLIGVFHGVLASLVFADRQRNPR